MTRNVILPVDDVALMHVIEAFKDLPNQPLNCGLRKMDLHIYYSRQVMVDIFQDKVYVPHWDHSPIASPCLPVSVMTFTGTSLFIRFIHIISCEALTRKSQHHQPTGKKRPKPHNLNQ